MSVPGVTLIQPSCVTDDIDDILKWWPTLSGGWTRSLVSSVSYMLYIVIDRVVYIGMYWYSLRVFNYHKSDFKSLWVTSLSYTCFCINLESAPPYSVHHVYPQRYIIYLFWAVMNPNSNISILLHVKCHGFIYRCSSAIIVILTIILFHPNYLDGGDILLLYLC